MISGIDMLDTCMTYIVFDIFQSRLRVGIDDYDADDGSSDGGEEMTKEFGFFDGF
jgi:hypothetical protein